MESDIEKLNVDKPFYVGLCMAGAVSAGAYTAGVMDFLLEALLDWEERKIKEEANVPTHRVIIPVIGGASAGGMTGIITAGALQKKFNPVYHTDIQNDVLKEQPHNPFYASWVDMLQRDMLTMLLDTNDIKKDKKVYSLLNASFIDIIANQSVTGGNHPLPPFIAPNLKILVTINNLEGYQTKESFRSEIAKSDYYMVVHNDYACYELGSKGHSNTLGWQKVDMHHESDLKDLRNAAMATGAFPGGLKSRILERDGQQVIESMRQLSGIYITDIDPYKRYQSQHVDGGVMNNEPFEKIKKILAEISDQTNEECLSNYNTFNHTLLMIDPFPATKQEKQSIDLSLIPTLMKTLSSMLNQSRIKPELLQKTIDPNDSSQFMISPSRRRTIGNEPEEKPQGQDAIACGALGGFSGFINKEFRIHDYFLGRHNCKVFLKKYFTIPEESLEKNAIFKKGYEGVDLKEFLWEDENRKKHVPIIPLFGEKNNENFHMPRFSCGSDWPMITETMIDEYSPAIKERVSLVANYIQDFPFSIRLMLGISGFFGLWKKATQKIIHQMKKSLEESRLISS